MIQTIEAIVDGRRAGNGPFQQGIPGCGLEPLRGGRHLVMPAAGSIVRS
ncbi:MAG: hypothetical protein WC076_04730 [Terrimicrobiaceae bacterium]|nr:hypothetical protein [Terrimicrobiaceae bacterium]